MHTDESELRTARRVNVDSVFRWPSFSHAVLADGHIYLSGVMGTVGTELPQLADGEQLARRDRPCVISSRCWLDAGRRSWTWSK
jgi:hypothetical protein